MNWAGDAARIFGGDASEVLGRDASKFTERGRVKISAVRVAVADTGIGIKAEHTGMHFEAFRQLDGSAKRIYEGTDHHEDSQCR